jgi:hypothetical protein
MDCAWGTRQTLRTPEVNFVVGVKDLASAIYIASCVVKLEITRSRIICYRQI